MYYFQNHSNLLLLRFYWNPVSVVSSQIFITCQLASFLTMHNKLCVCMFEHVCVFMYVCMYVCICICVSVWLCIFAYKYSLNSRSFSEVFCFSFMCIYTCHSHHKYPLSSTLPTNLLSRRQSQDCLYWNRVSKFHQVLCIRNITDGTLFFKVWSMVQEYWHCLWDC